MFHQPYTLLLTSVHFSALHGHVVTQNRNYATSSNLIRHVKACIGHDDDNDVEMEVAPYSHACLWYHLGKWMCVSNRPYALVDNPGFGKPSSSFCLIRADHPSVKVMLTANPQVVLPSQTTISRDVKRNLSIATEHMVEFLDVRTLTTFFTYSPS